METTGGKRQQDLENCSEGQGRRKRLAKETSNESEY